MRATVRIITVIAVLAGALSAGRTAGAGQALQFELVDGTVLTGRIDAKTIPIRIPSGNVLKVPVAELTELIVVLKKQRESVDRAQGQSKIQAGGTTLLGTVAVKEFRIASPYGPVAVKLDDIRRIRPAVRVTPGKFGRWIIALRDGTRLKGKVTDQSLRVRSRYGTIVVPFAQIQQATFGSDGMTVRARCRNSDRIIGALGAKTTISLKTDKAKVDLSAGKIAVAAYGPLTLEGHSDGVFSVAFSPDGKRLASGGFDATVKLWDSSTGKQLLALKGHSDVVRSVAFSPDGKRLASVGGWDKTIRLWDTRAGQELLAFKWHSDGVFSVAFSPDGKFLAVGGHDWKKKAVKLYDAVTGKELLVFEGHRDGVFSVAFSPDGKRMASGGRDASLKFWDTATGKELITRLGRSGAVHSVVFSPDGKRLASGGGSGIIKLWDTAGGTELFAIKGHLNSIVHSVAFSPDGKRLASGSVDKTIKLWDTVAGKALITLKGHSGGVHSVAFSPDGKRLASASQDGTIKLWDLPDSTKPAK